MNYKALFSILSSMFLTVAVIGQNCAKWDGLPDMEQLLEHHSVYRDNVKLENYADAIKPWEIVYSKAPAADGKRDFHFTDGIKIYKYKLANATEAEKPEMKKMILELYDGCITCYNEGVLTIKGGDEAVKKRVAYLLGQKAYDMYYELNSDYGPNMEAFETAVKLGGNNTLYNVLIPYAAVTTYQFQKGKIEAEKARAVFDEIIPITEHNIEAGGDYAPYYENALANINSELSKIDEEIYDCAYFKTKLRPKYDENPDDPELARELYGQLIRRGCDKTDPLVSELEKKYETWAAGVNAQKQAEFEANNPGMLAKKAYDSGDYDGAISKYREAINMEDDMQQKASYHYYIASTLFRKKKEYSAARQEARTAISLNPNYGRAYMLIGDMYATSARNCGDSWNQRLAVLAAMGKYSKAASIDPSVADEANNKKSKYRGSLPDKSEGFLRGVKEGDKQKVGCWIGETVTVEY